MQLYHFWIEYLRNNKKENIILSKKQKLKKKTVYLKVFKVKNCIFSDFSRVKSDKFYTTQIITYHGLSFMKKKSGYPIFGSFNC